MGKLLWRIIPFKIGPWSKIQNYGSNTSKQNNNKFANIIKHLSNMDFD